MKKHTGKGMRAGKRQAKDLTARRTRNIKGGETLQSSVLKKLREAGDSVIQKV